MRGLSARGVTAAGESIASASSPCSPGEHEVQHLRVMASIARGGRIRLIEERLSVLKYPRAHPLESPIELHWFGAR